MRAVASSSKAGASAVIAVALSVLFLVSSASASGGFTWAGAASWPGMGGRLYRGDVTWNNSTYWIGTQSQGSWFTTGQNADMVLDSHGFDNSGGPLSFNNPTSVATDGTHLLVTDADNNRVLIWNTLPSGNVPPDLVLGQANFTTNLSGNSTSQMDWPVSVSTDGTHVVVADADNNRILIWNEFPTRNNQPADLVIDCCQWDGLQNGGPAAQNWPNAVWTNGTVLIVTATLGGYVFIWNHFPTRNNQPPDLWLLPGGVQEDTPRSIISNGRYLMVADENAHLPNGTMKAGTWVWTTFPTQNDTSPNFLMTQPEGKPSAIEQDEMWGTFTPDGELVTIAMNGKLFIWNTPPQRATDAASLYVGTGCSLFYIGLYRWCTGSPAGGVAYAGGRLYVAVRFGQKIVGFNSLPDANTSVPDFVIGAPSTTKEPTIMEWFGDNPIPSSDGKSLIVTSSNSLMYVWQNLPDQGGATPNIFYDNPTCQYNASLFCYSSTSYFQAYGQALYGNTFVAVGGNAIQKVWIWNELPTSGQGPSTVYTGKIGNVTFTDLTGVALDASHLYISDAVENKIWVWNGIPGPNTNPAYTINITAPGQMDSDGTHLAVQLQQMQNRVAIFNVSSISSPPVMVTLNNPSAPNGEKYPGIRAFNGVGGVAVGDGHLFVTDGGNNRVVAWRSIQDALDGKPPDVVLGQTNFESRIFGNGPDHLFIPTYIAWDGTHLWVGSYKFAHALVRYTLPPITGDQTFNLSVDGRQMGIGALTGDTVSDVAYNPGLMAIRFTANATASGSTELLFPDALLNGTLSVTVDGTQAPLVAGSYNSTYTSVKVSYPMGLHSIEITGSNALEPTAASDLDLTVTGSNFAPQAHDAYPYQLLTDGPLGITATLKPGLSDGNLTLEYRSTVLSSGCGFCDPWSQWKQISSSTPINGKAAVVWIPPAEGTYEVRALWGGDPTHEVSASTTFDFQVYTNPSTTTTTTSTTSTTNSSQTSTTSVNPHGNQITFLENGLPSGTSWSVVLDQSNESAAAGSPITFSNVSPGQHSFGVQSHSAALFVTWGGVSGGIRVMPMTAPYGMVTVNGSGSVTADFMATTSPPEHASAVVQNGGVNASVETNGFNFSMGLPPNTAVTLNGMSFNAQAYDYGTAAPTGTTRIPGAQFFDASLMPSIPPNGAQQQAFNVLARLCVSGSGVGAGSQLEFWNGTVWLQLMSQATGSDRICGAVPLVQLFGTPIALLTLGGSGTPTSATQTAPVSSGTSPQPSLLGLVAIPVAIVVAAVIIAVAILKKSKH